MSEQAAVFGLITGLIGLVIGFCFGGSTVSERVIAKPVRMLDDRTDTYTGEVRTYHPDPEAPSVAEVVEVLRGFRGDLKSALQNLASERAIRWTMPEDRQRTDMEIKTDETRIESRLCRIDNLIARLEGA